MISETHTGNHSNFIQEFYPIKYNSNVLKMKRSWYLQRKINFNILINNQLGPVWRANISKMFEYLFLSAHGYHLNISTLSTLVFLLLQKFEFTLHFKFCCVIREWSRNFNPSSYIQRSPKLYSRCISWRGSDRDFFVRSW